ncbi:ABC-2 family transporter [Halanaerobium saccharolyticum]|uniref:ABC-2 family transporter n=1 Tax=Halanaerobium saccharolyticum TaxID=43595 RepID=A0A4R6M460_9FIRM|nr:ABC transporter permease [Halanaerobium saccharolyticum]TDO95280.1 ABC-2 family transporter [Halanaerobium saccharolyticum]
MRSLLSLIKNEFKQLNILIIVSALIIAAWEWFLLTRTEHWPPGVSFGLGFIPLFFLPLIMIFLGYNSYRSEWGNNTIYLLKILPRKGYEINFAKFFPTFVYNLILSGALILVNLYFHQDFLAGVFRQIPEMLGREVFREFLILAYLSYLITGIQMYLITQFSYIIASFYNRFRLLISILIFILSHYFILRVGGFFNYLFNWLPDFPVTVFMENPAGVTESTIYIGSAPFVVILLLMTGLFFLNSRLIASDVDV